MTVLYVKQQGAVVYREVEQIKVRLPRMTEAAQQPPPATPVRELEQVVLFGNVQLTTQAAALLLQHAVDVVFLSQSGVYRGRLSQDGAKHVRLRHAQLALAGDGMRALAVAKRVVQAKLANQSTLLADLAADAQGTLAQTLRVAARGVARMQQECAAARDADSLRGYEGKGGALYFGALKALLPAAWGFQGRAYYPPPDPMNALLSFGYALLLKDMTTTLQLVGLDPYLGCLHALEYGRPSLTLDLMEEFRPLVVDRPMLTLALSGSLTPAHFVFTGTPQRPVELGAANLPLVIRAYEQRLDTVVRHPPSGTAQTLRRCLELQARLFARVVLQQAADYQGLVV